jgi:WD40 repeat protein
LFLTRGETGTENTIVSIWDISDPSSPAEVNKTQSTAGVSEVVISLDGELAAYSKYSGSGAAKMTILDLSSPGQVQVRGELEGDQASFSPDGTLIAIPNVSQPDGTFAIQLWDTSDLSAKKELGSLKGFPKAIKTIAFSPDGTLFAAGCDDKTITIWDISKPAAPRKLSTLSGHSDWINTVVFSPDGKILASGSDDKNIVLWGVEDPNDIVQIGTLKGHLSSVSEVFYSADGRALLSRERTGPAFLWDIDPSSWMDKACHIVGSNFSDDKWAQLFPDKTYRETCVNMLLTSIEPPAPIEELTSSSPTTLPACSDPSGTAGCPLLTVDERDRFCIDSVSYTLYALPEGTTLTPPDSSYTCTNEGVRGGFQMYTCYSLEHPNTSFQANVCNTSCQVVGSDQCESGFGLDSSQSCCAPVSSDGCFEVTLEIGGCTQ